MVFRLNLKLESPYIRVNGAMCSMVRSVVLFEIPSYFQSGTWNNFGALLQGLIVSRCMLFSTTVYLIFV